LVLSRASDELVAARAADVCLCVSRVDLRLHRLTILASLPCSDRARSRLQSVETPVVEGGVADPPSPVLGASEGAGASFGVAGCRHLVVTRSARLITCPVGP